MSMIDIRVDGFIKFSQHIADTPAFHIDGKNVTVTFELQEELPPHGIPPVEDPTDALSSEPEATEEDPAKDEPKYEPRPDPLFSRTVAASSANTNPTSDPAAPTETTES